VWLGLYEPTPQELDQVRDAFGLHELAVEDARTFHLRPKVELYEGDVRLVILRTTRYDDEAEEVEFGEISVFAAPDFVITVRQGSAGELRPAPKRLEQRPDLLAAGTSSVLWAILDQVVDGYAPVVAGLEDDIDQIEATVFSETAAPAERIYSLRREATGFYRAVHPLLGVLTAIERAAASEVQPYLRDVQDTLLLVNDEVAAQRDALGTVLEANMAVLSVEQARIGNRQERHHRTAHHPGHYLPAADVRHRLLRPELRLAHRAHHHPGHVRHLRDRRSGGVACCADVVAQAPPGRYGHQRGGRK
jgi:magnesium transporter